MNSVMTSVDIAFPDWKVVYFRNILTNQNPYEASPRIIGSNAKNKSFKKKELNMLAPLVIPDCKKQSMLNI